MINYDFNEPTDKELLELVKRYEEAVNSNSPQYFNESTLEQIIDFYLDKLLYARALSVADSALSQFPFSSFFLSKKAEILISKNEYDEALVTISKAEVLDPNNIQLLLLKADAFLSKSNHSAALHEVQKAIDVCDPDELADLYLEMADIYEDWERHKKVREYLEKALIINPKNEEALNRLWFVIELSEEYQHSIMFHTKLIDKLPYNAIAWFNLAHAYIGVKNYDDAIDAFQYAVAIDEKLAAAYTDCADLLFKLKRYREAISSYLDAIYCSKATKENYFNLAVCHEKTGENQKARYYYRKAVKIDPHFAEAFFRIGYNYGADAQYHQAIGSLEKAVTLKEKNVNYLRVLAYMYTQAEDFEKATDVYQKLVVKEGDKKENWINLANVLFDSGKVQECLDILSEGESTFDSNSEFSYFKASILYASGMKKDAILNLEKGLAKNFDEHYIIFEINPNFASDPDIRNTIDQYKH